MMFRLHDFQQQALAAEDKHRADHPDETRLAIVLPTGTGKGTILAERARRFHEEDYDRTGRERVLVIVHTEELVEQLAASCRFAASLSEFPISVGIVKAERDETTADIIVASRQTLEIRERRARITGVGLVIVDEIHIGPSAYGPIMEYFGCMSYCPDHGNQYEDDCSYCDAAFDCTPALGFTATMERSDGAGLGGIWQNVVFTRDISWAVRKGYLVQPVGYRLEIPVASAEPGEQDAILCDGIAPERIVEKWMELCVRPVLCESCRDAMDCLPDGTIAAPSWCDQPEGKCATLNPALVRQTIVFAPLVKSAKRIAAVFEQAGFTTGVVWGEQPPKERRETIAAFKAGKIDVLVNAMVLTAGFDHPGIGCVIVARPTKSRTLFVQMAGRGLRRVPGIPVEEQDCILITLTDGTSDLCSVADLSDRALDPRAEGALTVMEDAFDLGKDLEEASRHWAGKVDATRFDPIVARSSKVWAKTRAGHWFLPISTEREYVFLVGTDIHVLARHVDPPRVITMCLHRDLPDVEIAMQVAEDEATERGGDLGALVADRTRPWRKAVPKPGDKMLAYASRLGLDGEVQRILASPAGGKAGKVSDLIRRVEASRSIDRAVIRIKERAGE